MRLQRKNRRQMRLKQFPRIAIVAREKDFAGVRADVEASLVAVVAGAGLPEHLCETVLLRETFREFLPSLAAVAGAIDCELRVADVPTLRANLRHDVDGLLLVWVDDHREAEP